MIDDNNMINLRKVDFVSLAPHSQPLSPVKQMEIETLKARLSLFESKHEDDGEVCQ